MIVAVGVDEKSLQRRLFKFTGCRGRPTIDIPKEILELYLNPILPGRGGGGGPIVPALTLTNYNF